MGSISAMGTRYHKSERFYTIIILARGIQNAKKEKVAEWGAFLSIATRKWKLRFSSKTQTGKNRDNGSRMRGRAWYWTESSHMVVE